MNYLMITLNQHLFRLIKSIKFSPVSWLYGSVKVRIENFKIP